MESEIFDTIEAANRYLLETGYNSDVIFLIGRKSERVLGHKYVLISRSSVFETMFLTWLTWNNCKIQVPDTTVHIFKHFLKVFYNLFVFS